MNMKNIKKIIGIFLIITTCFYSEKTNILAATTVNSLPIITYTIPAGRVTTYTGINGEYSGYIDGGVDLCTIFEVYDSGWVKVQYPITGGKKIAYTQSSNFFAFTDFSTSVIQLGSKKTVYRRSNLQQNLGTVYEADNVIVVGVSAGNTQIIYPISGGYKMGWINGIYNTNSDVEAYIEDGYYQIKFSSDTNYVLDIYGAWTDNCANLQLCSNWGGGNQAFIIKRQSNGYYVIEAIHSGKVLDIENNGMAAGANII